MEAVAELNEGETQFFDHRNSEIVQQLGETEFDI